MKKSRTHKALVAVAKKEWRTRARRARAALGYFDRFFDVYRTSARNHGYALAVHGSLLRDIDLIAVPWVEDAKKPEELRDAFVKLAQNFAGRAGKKYVMFDEKPTVKPHIRIAYSIHVNQRTYIDLSIVRPFK